MGEDYYRILGVGSPVNGVPFALQEGVKGDTDLVDIKGARMSSENFCFVSSYSSFLKKFVKPNQNPKCFFWTPVMFILFLINPVFAAEIMIDDYYEGLSPHWEEKSFKGKTFYDVIVEDNMRCIRAHSISSASGLYFKMDYDSKTYPILSWHWKVEHILTKGDARKKEGDDFAARVYVIFPHLIFWKTKAITYIWANKLSRGHAVHNPFTSNSIMIAVESGSTLSGKWVQERRDILKDYRKYFGQDPPRVGAIAIMTDTDNTGEEATAWYGPIRVLSE